MKTLVGSPEPYDYNKTAANYRRVYLGTMTGIATALRKAASLRSRK